MRYVLGIDGGGTKCDAVVMDEQGTVMGWGRGGSSHGLYVGNHSATRSVRRAVRDALPASKPTVAVVAGTGLHAAQLGEWIDQPFLLDQFVPAGEVAMGFATALTTHGILVLSGTGSFVCGVTTSGRTLQEGGNGCIIADEGSAYHIGVLGIRAAFRSHYSEARRTTLAQAVPRALGVDSMHDVFNLVYVNHVGRSRIASVAKAVDAEAEAGDAVAAGVLERAADELGELLLEVIRELEFTGTDEHLVANGSVAQGSRLFWQRVCAIARSGAPGLRPVCPRVRPVVGACLLALRRLGVNWTPALLERIIETQEPFVARL